MGIPGALGASPAPRLPGCRFAAGFPRGRRFPADEAESGQGTVEFAVITVGFIAVAAAFGDRRSLECHTIPAPEF